MEMECRPLEIVLISGQDLKDVNLFSKMDVYAIVTIEGDRDKQKQKTKVDKDCGPNPKWNQTMKFTIDESAAKQNRLTLEIEIKSDRIGGDKEIGKVHVPMKELLDNEKEDKTVSYSVRTPSGKSKGTLNFSYKFGEKFTVAAPPPPPVVDTKAGYPVMAYPPAGYPGSSSGYPQYPPQAGYPPPGQYAYPPPAGQYGYPPPPQQGYGGYPPQAGYGGYPPQPGYGGYGPQKPKKSGGAGMALGVGAGLLGGLLVGDMISDSYEAGFDDGAGMDF